MSNKKEYMKQYYKNNIEKIRKIHKQWWVDNPEYKKQYYETNKEQMDKYQEQYRINNKERILERNRQYYEDNYERIKKWRREYFKKKNKEDLRFNLNSRILRAVNHSLKDNKKGKHWEDLVGYTLNDLIKRLNETMPEGYNWNDYVQGKLHIDHIIPIRAFIFDRPEDREFGDCWSLYNLRLLLAEENLLKNDSISSPILLLLLLKH